MTEEDLKKLREADSDGLLTYEYIANNIGECDADLERLAELLCSIDKTGQFTASAARFLHAIDADKYDVNVRTLVASTIDHDREHKYLAALMESLYGPGYTSDAERLCAEDNNFRRMYKRLYNNNPM